MSPSGIVLDTHVWVWLIGGDKKLSQKSIELVEKSIEDRVAYISSISLWEVSMLVKKNRITLDQPTLPWIKNALKVSGIELVHLTPEIVVESTELPGNFHGDPADRLIVATARILDLIILTRDDKILEYGELKRIHSLKM